MSPIDRPLRCAATTTVVLLSLLLVAPLAPPALAADDETERERLHRETFDWAWNRIAETYWDPDFGGVDWQAVADELRPRAVAARSDAQLRAVLTEMLGRLGQSHFGVVAGAGSGLDGPDPEAQAEGNDEVAGEGSCPPAQRRRLRELLEDEDGTASVGLELRLVEGTAVVSGVDEAGPAAEAGIAPGWLLRAVDGIDVGSMASCLDVDVEDVADRWVVLTSLGRLLEGTEGSEVALELTDAGGAQVALALSRRPGPGEWIGFGNLPPLEFRFDSRAVATDAERRVVVIRFSAWLMPLMERFEQAYRAASDADGLVIDLRGNPGGIGGLVMGVSGYLHDEAESLGSLLSRRDRLEFRVNPRRVAADGAPIPIYTGPVAVLVDGMTASTSEIFAAGLQDLGRIRVFGETTMGAALPAMLERMPNGDLLMHAVADFLRPSGERIEGTGVVPDEPVALDRPALLAGRDPVLERALHWIDRANAENPAGGSGSGNMPEHDPSSSP